MTKRPLSITLIATCLILVGLISLSAGLIEVVGAISGSGESSRSISELLLICLLRLVALVGGVFMLYGMNWARWLAILWMGSHVAISFWHSTFQVILHALLLMLMVFFLFRAKANEYFRSSG